MIRWGVVGIFALAAASGIACAELQPRRATEPASVAVTSPAATSPLRPGSSPLTAAFEASRATGRAPLEVVFTDTSSGGPTTWEWDFQNDGVVDATGPTPSFVFETGGYYSVRLRVSRDGQSAETVAENMVLVVFATPTTASATDTPTPAPPERPAPVTAPASTQPPPNNVASFRGHSYLIVTESMSWPEANAYGSLWEAIWSQSAMRLSNCSSPIWPDRTGKPGFLLA